MCFKRPAQVLRFSAAALLLLTACRRSNPLHQTELPVGEKQQIIALHGTEKLREQWNSGSCEALYEQASAFFRSQSLPDWLSQCEQLQENLGGWQSFVSQKATMCGESGKSTRIIVCLDGVALFEKDRFKLEIGWMLENSRSWLMFLSSGRNGTGLGLIPPQSQRLFDSPPVPITNPARSG